MRRLPQNPSLEHLRNEARSVQRAIRSGDPHAFALLAEHHPRATAMLRRTDAGAGCLLADAQLIVARQYGFASWPKLRQHLTVVERYGRSPHRVPEAARPAGERDSTDLATLADEFLRLSCLTYGGDHPSRREQARTLLAAHPEIARASISTMAVCDEADAARELLARQPDLANRQGGPHRWEPLLYLAYGRVGQTDGGSVETARVLLTHGADPNAGYLWEGLPSPFTVLTGVLGEGEGGATQPPHPQSLPLARLLLDAGANPNDSQALYNRQFRPGTVHLELLLEYGLGRGDGGIWHARLGPTHPTPTDMIEDQLLWAAHAGMLDRVRLLLANGVRVDGRGTEHPVFGGRCAYAVAVLNGHTEIADLLRAAGARSDTVDPVVHFLGVCLSGDIVAVERLLASDPGLLTAARKQHPDAMIRAAELGRVEAVRLLAGLGFDVNARRRVSALHQAAWNGDLDMVTTLLALGADPTLRDEEHDVTPLGWARYNGRQTVVHVLEPLTPNAPS